MPEAPPDMFAAMQANLGVPTPPQPEAPPEPKKLTPDEYAAYKAAGWTDDQLKAGGFVVVPFEPAAEPPKPEEPAPAPKTRPRGRPQKSAAVKILEACASGGITDAAVVDMYLGKLEDLK